MLNEFDGLAKQRDKEFNIKLEKKDTELHTCEMKVGFSSATVTSYRA